MVDEIDATKKAKARRGIRREKTLSTHAGSKNERASMKGIWHTYNAKGARRKAPQFRLNGSDHYGTNAVLSEYGFYEEALRTQIFLAYGKNMVRKGIELYINSPINVQREEAGSDPELKAQGIIATIDLVARKDHHFTERWLNARGNVLDLTKRFYSSNGLPDTAETDTIARTKYATHNYLIQTYILGQIVPLPDIAVSVGSPSPTLEGRISHSIKK